MWSLALLSFYLLCCRQIKLSDCMHVKQWAHFSSYAYMLMRIWPLNIAYFRLHNMLHCKLTHHWNTSSQLGRFAHNFILNLWWPSFCGIPIIIYIYVSVTSLVFFMTMEYCLCSFRESLLNRFCIKYCTVCVVRIVSAFRIEYRNALYTRWK